MRIHIYIYIYMYMWASCTAGLKVGLFTSDCFGVFTALPAQHTILKYNTISQHNII